MTLPTPASSGSRTAPRTHERNAGRDIRIRRSVLLALCAAAGTTLAGPLLPPPGPVTSTGRPLDQIEPRASVNDLPGDATAAHVISASGNYVLTADVLAAAGQNGIRIDAPSATIDLNGFSITGQPGSLNGISATFVNGRYVLRSGAPATISGFDADGIHIENAERLELENLRVDGNGGDAIEAGGRASPSSSLRADSISAVGNAGTGLLVTDFCTYRILKGEFRDNGEGARCSATTAIQNARTQVHVHDSMFTGNITDGITVEQIGDESVSISYEFDDFSANGGSGAIVRKTRANSVHVKAHSVSAARNGSHGIDIRGINMDESEDASMDHVYASGNGADGVHVEHYRMRLHDATTNDNVGNGVAVSGGSDHSMEQSIDDLVASGNAGGLLVVNADLRLNASSLTGNTGAGITCQAAGVVGQSFILDATKSSDNGTDGILVDAADPVLVTVTITDSSFERNTNNGASFSWTQTGGPFKFSMADSDLSANGLDGLRATGDPNRRASVDAIACRASGNTGRGMSVDFATDVRIHDCTASGNGTGGMLCGNTQHFIAADNDTTGNTGDGLSVATVTDFGMSRCVSSRNTGNGTSIADAGNISVRDSEATGNGTHGMIAYSTLGISSSSVRVTGSSFSSNTLAGLSISDSLTGQVTACSAFSNGTTGIEVLALNHVITDNTAGGNAANYSVALPGNAVGSLVDETNISQSDSSSNRAP